MKRFYFKTTLFVIVFSFCVHSNVKAQGGSRYSLKGTTWVFGLGTNLVIDNGTEFAFKFDPEKNWNLPTFPSKFTVDGLITRIVSVQSELAFNQYKPNKLIDKFINTKVNTFFSGDGNILFHLNNRFKRKDKWFDPYLSAGFGLTFRQAASNKFTGTNNLGLGCNIFLSKTLGFGVQGQCKFGLKGGPKSTYLHHSFSLIYRFRTVTAKNSFN